MAKEYEIGKTSGRCARCGRELAAGEEFTATVRDMPDDLQREDYCAACWTAEPRQPGGDLIGIWRSRVPQPQEKRRLFVDNEMLINFFERLDGAEEPVKVSFRFVLALVLMRKKLLVYDRSRPADGNEVWTMHFKGGDAAHEVVNPQMDDDRIAEVSGQLGQILEGEL